MFLFSCFFRSNFPDEIVVQNNGFACFFSWLVCRAAISACYREFTFLNNFATLLIMALLPQVYILVVILMQIWEAPDLSVLKAFLVLTHEKNMLAKHQKVKPVHEAAHTGTRLGAATLGSVFEANLTALETPFYFRVAHKASLTRRPCATRFLCLHW